MDIEQYDYSTDMWTEIFTHSRADIVISEYEDLIKTSVVPLRVLQDGDTILRLFHLGSGNPDVKKKEAEQRQLTKNRIG
jgi:hypothetical protein